MQQSLAEKWRPVTWSEVAGQEEVVERVHHLIARQSLAGRFHYLTGPSGTGKTSIARLICAEVADPGETKTLDAEDAGVKVWKALEKGWKEPIISDRQGRGYIVDEAQQLPSRVIEHLLKLSDRLPSNVVVVFTSTEEPKPCAHLPAFFSRCVRLDLTRSGICEPLAERAWHIAKVEGLTGGRDFAAVRRLVKERRNNMRAVLQDLESGILVAA